MNPTGSFVWGDLHTLRIQELPHVLRALLLGLVVLLFVDGCGSHHAHVASPVAIVAGQRIDSSELRHYLTFAARFYAGSVGSGSLDCTRSTTSSACAIVKRQVLTRLLQERVVLKYATDHRISLRTADRARVNVAMKNRATYKGSDATFLHEVLARELLVQKVEEQVAPTSTRRGVSFHLRKFFIPFSGVSDRPRAYKAALNLATDGSPIPDAATVREEWQAPFRLSAGVRQALGYASPGQFVGPFANRSTYLVIQYVARQPHLYGAPARNELMTRYFRTWLRNQLLAEAPQCFDSQGKKQRCPV